MSGYRHNNFCTVSIVIFIYQSLYFTAIAYSVHVVAKYIPRYMLDLKCGLVSMWYVFLMKLEQCKTYSEQSSLFEIIIDLCRKNTLKERQ